MTEIIMIAAMAKNNVIGNRGKIPWRIKEDFARFKKITTGYPIIMGRKTFESLPAKPLSGRKNIVVTSQKDFLHDGAIIVHSIEDAIACCKNNEKIFIIGGGEIYNQSIKFADRLEITMVEGEFEGDTFFPEISQKEWKMEKEEKHDNYSFQTYKRKNLEQKM